MKRRIWLLSGAVALALALTALGARAWLWSSDAEGPAAGEGEPLELDWQALIPEGFVPYDPFADMGQDEINRLLDGSAESNAELARIDEKMSYAPTVEALDGQRVRIPGFVVPLDFDGQTTLEEFLLVPYFGACIHTPPPPANQVVHAESEEPIELGNTYDPVWAIGTLRTETVRSDLAESGYRLELERVEPYADPDTAAGG